jgi:hypothetical protein
MEKGACWAGCFCTTTTLFLLIICSKTTDLAQSAGLAFFPTTGQGEKPSFPSLA